MVDAVTILAVALLVAGIVGTILPLVPGGLLSLSGVYLYWWHTSYSEPGILGLAVLTLLGLLTVATELFGGAVSARAGGAAWETTAAAVIVAVVLTMVTGPIGLLVGLFGTVFLLEIYRGGEVEESARAAGYATVGILASTAVQVALTGAMLLGFLVVVFVL